MRGRRVRYSHSIKPKLWWIFTSLKLKNKIITLSNQAWKKKYFSLLFNMSKLKCLWYVNNVTKNYAHKKEVFPTSFFFDVLFSRLSGEFKNFVCDLSKFLLCNSNFKKKKITLKRKAFVLYWLLLFVPKVLKIVKHIKYVFKMPYETCIVDALLKKFKIQWLQYVTALPTMRFPKIREGAS